jgi:F-type H+-transporting ATPase subunit epsilon
MAAPKALASHTAASTGQLDVDLVTPRGTVAHTAADGVTAPGEEGEFQLLAGHVPLLVALRPGVLTIGDKVGSRYAVSGGYLRVDTTGRVEILVEQAMTGSSVDVEAAKVEQKAAEAELAKWGDRPLDGDYKNLRARADWASARIAAASHGGASN